MIIRYIVLMIAFVFTISGCFNNGPPIHEPNPVQDITPKKELPQFEKGPNKGEISDSFNDTDPEWVIGSIFKIDDGNVSSFRNFLKKDAKVDYKTASEIAFKSFIENELALEVGWLDFLKGQLSDKIRAEVSFIKVAHVTVPRSAMNVEAIINYANSLDEEQIKKIGVIIAYSDYLVSASLFKDFGAEVGASGYGARIGGKWFSKFEDTTSYHRLIATYSTLEFLKKLIKSAPVVDRALPEKPLDVIVREAIEKGDLKIRKLERPLTIQPR